MEFPFQVVAFFDAMDFPPDKVIMDMDSEGTVLGVSPKKMVLGYLPLGNLCYIAIESIHGLN